MAVHSPPGARERLATCAERDLVDFVARTDPEGPVRRAAPGVPAVQSDPELHADLDPLEAPAGPVAPLSDRGHCGVGE